MFYYLLQASSDKCNIYSYGRASQEPEKEFSIRIFHRSGRGVTLTPEGADFILYARQVYNQYKELLERCGKSKGIKKKFGVSSQHYSFVVKAFVELVKEYDTLQYDFAILETQTKDVISLSENCFVQRTLIFTIL